MSTAQVAVAQKKRNNTPAVPTITLAEAISQYRFEEAIELLEEQIEQLRKKNQSTEEAESQLYAVERAQSRLNATEQVIFIDSVVVDKDSVFQHIYLSEEVGQISSYQSYFASEKSQASSVFLSQLKDKMLYAEKDKAGHYQLYSKDRIGNDWTEASPLSGLADLDDVHQNFPYMSSDGITLYYAAQGSESIGGYDIFMTRYDADDHSFLTPENIGMPFNSPANDYLYVVDDFVGLGYFVTDRYQHEGKVCIYCFIPNETRKVYDANKLAKDRLRSLAKLHRIKDTWTNQSAVEEAQGKLALLRDASGKIKNTNSSLAFVLNDARVYQSANDFRNDEAKKLYEFWVEGKHQLQKMEQDVEQLRLQYSLAQSDTRDQLRPQIIGLEQKIKDLYRSLLQQEKDIRKHELK